MANLGQFYADLELPDLPVTYCKFPDPVHRRTHPAICRAENACPAGIHVMDAMALECSRRDNRHGCPGIDEQVQAASPSRSGPDQEVCAATLQRDSGDFGSRHCRSLCSTSKISIRCPPILTW